MPIAARWRSLDDLPPARGREAQPGVYELADAEKRVIYIGQSATDVPNRLRQHLSRHGCIRERAVYWRREYSRVPKAAEADLLAAHLRLFGEPPACNRANARVRGRAARYAERSGGE